jgi:hypothetical protein
LRGVIILFSGHIGRSGLGGQAWANLQYISGLQALGHEAVYLEDWGEYAWSWDWQHAAWNDHFDCFASYVRDAMASVGLRERWICRAGDRSIGMARADFLDACAQADLLIIRALPILAWRPEYDRPRRRAFIDVDPGFTQIGLSQGDLSLAETLAHCERLFTLGQHLGAPDCPLPTGGRQWLKTVPPVDLSFWPLATTPRAAYFTSILRWRGLRDASFNGQTYGQRDREFPRFITLPRLVEQPFRVAQLGGSGELASHGWQVLFGEKVTKTPAMYRRFVLESRAEFGVAKHGYAHTNSGWFSDRSVCFLACGLPILVQDTGLADWLPVGEGIVAFRDLDEAVRGVGVINADYEAHRRAARRLAEEYFDAERVLTSLLEQVLD